MMSSLTLLQSLNKNKVFILNQSEIEKRLDPHFYKEEFKENVARIKQAKHKRLSELVKFSNETWNQQDYFDSTFPYIEISEIDTNTGEILNVSIVEKDKAPSRAKLIVRENDIVVSTTRPHRGAISLIDKQKDFSIASTGFSVIRNITSTEISREYLFTAIRQQFALMQLLQRSSGGNYPAITQDELGNILIPLPPKEKQEIAVNLLKKSYEQKKQNEAQAEKLLSSIDDYLLKELGITLPAPPENILKNRIFQVSINQVSGNRFDPLYHQGSIYSGLEKSKFKYKNLKEISKYLINGFAAGKQDQNIFGEGIIQIRPTNISDKREFVFNKNIYIDLSRKNDLKNELLCKNEVLFNNTNSQELVGKACVFNLEGAYFCSNHITRIGLYEEYISDYVGVILNLYQKNKVFYKSCINWNNQSGINLDILKTIKIPVPPPDKQKQIAEHISAIRKQAQQLKDKTKEELKKASEEIEKILLN